MRGRIYFPYKDHSKQRITSTATAMKTSFGAQQQVAMYLLLAILIIHNVFQAHSASSLQPHQGTVFSGTLRRLPSTPPPPQIGQPPHYRLPCPPPPPPPLALQIDRIASSFRTVGRGSPPAPKPSRPRYFHIFLSPPPPPPPESTK
ncbi:wiskott-Aldrich syndrome protein family member 2 [Helianthus annuus]|nr:wiskott-Aldrich syndrome protein family member 2 [Helianthus annuus]